jgi:hypothetical protein
VQEERWRGGERKGSAWVSRGDVIEEDEEDDDDSEDDSNETLDHPHTTDAPEVVPVVAASDRLQVWRCRRQGRLEQNFELGGGLGGEGKLRFGPPDFEGEEGEPCERISIAVPSRPVGEQHHCDEKQ